MTSIFACLSSALRKMTAYAYCAGLARSPFVLTEHISSICIWYVRHTLVGGPGLRNVGGVKCQPFLRHSKHWKRALKMIFKESGCSSFLKLSLLLQRKKAYTLSNVVHRKSRCSIGVESAE